jgi:hypothetical protein
MPNSVNVKWAWVNLVERQPQTIDFKLNMMTLPEINSVNNFLEDQKNIVYGKDTASYSIGAFFEALAIALMLSFLALVGLNVIENYWSTQQERAKMIPMESHCEEESEMSNLRTRSTYLR